MCADFVTRCNSSPPPNKSVFYTALEMHTTCAQSNSHSLILKVLLTTVNVFLQDAMFEKRLDNLYEWQPGDEDAVFDDCLAKPLASTSIFRVHD